MLSSSVSCRINFFHATEVHRCNNLSVRVTEVCNESIATPLKLIFQKSLENDLFSEIRKRANVVPVHKKKTKASKYYRPISLLHIFGKIFQRVIYNSLFKCFICNKLFTSSQSDFFPKTSYIAQFLSIILETQTVFDEGFM